jgi:hypothetical protein
MAFRMRSIRSATLPRERLCFEAIGQLKTKIEAPYEVLLLHLFITLFLTESFLRNVSSGSSNMVIPSYSPVGYT